MNSLSFLLYLAGVAGNVQTVLALIGGIGLCGYIILYFITYMENVQQPAKKWGFWCLAVIIAATLIPDSKTMYAIILSEGGEQVMKSDTGHKAVDALNRYLDSIGKADE